MPAAQAAPKAGTIVRVDFDLAASNGFKAHLETSEKGVATLMLLSKTQFATYRTKAKVTEGGLRVSFGRLGSFDVAYTPTTILNSTEPGEGCTGRPRTLTEGIFAGTIRFRGERGFAQIEEPRVEGSMSVLPPWECPEAESLAPFANPSPIAALRPRGQGKTASLYVRAPHCSCLFIASVDRRRGKSSFYGARAERREGMRIGRVTSAEGGLGAFVFDQEAGTATVRPPRPLRGRATFEERPDGDLWRSTIRVPLPGADPLHVGGPRFRATFLHEDISD
ncbi:MAG: hypothetical protein ACTHNY_02755 [Solirubrobacterales bacterium]